MRTNTFPHRWTVLLALALTLAAGSRAAAPRLAVQKDPPWPLWLPAPGLPGAAPPESAPTADARERGLAAARSGDWPAAVAAFTEALDTAHATPALMFNLGLAYQKRGWAIPAALWYRAYLEAVPDAANAPAVRAEIGRLVAATQAESLRLLDEAERLADALPATAPGADAKSPRQAALEQILRYVHMGGLSDRAEALAQRIAALPGARPLAEIPDRYGFHAATRSLDAARTRQILRQWGASYTPELRFEGEMYLHANRREPDELRQVLAAAATQTVTFRLAPYLAYDAMAVNHVRRMEQSREFEATTFVRTIFPDLEDARYNGRPDVALPLARAARDYLHRFNITGWPVINEGHVWVLDALLGDRAALESSFRSYNPYGSWRIFAPFDVPEEGMMAARTALAIAATFSPAEAVELIDGMMAKGRPSTVAEESWPGMMPLSYFARWVAAGDAQRALASLDAEVKLPVNDPDYPGRRHRYDLHLRYALRFAVATGRTELALALADHMTSHSAIRLMHLQRLALDPGAAQAVRTRVEEHANRAGAGWRPRDVAQAWAVARRLELAKDGAQEVYASLTDVISASEKSTHDKPETLPADLAGSAVVRWIATLMARPDL